MPANIVNQPINDVIDSTAATFRSQYGVNPFDENKLRDFWSHESLREEYLDSITSVIGEESEREIIQSQIERSLKPYQISSGHEWFGGEGWDFSTQPASNAGYADSFAPITIIGYSSKTHMMDIYKTMNSKDGSKEIAFDFERLYIMDSNSTDISEQKTLPGAFRDGSIADMMNPEYVTLLSQSGAAGGPNIIKPASANRGYAKLGTIDGNMITESGKDPRRWALSEDIKIVEVLVDKTADIDADVDALTPIAVSAMAEVKRGGGHDSTERHISVRLTFDAEVSVPDGQGGTTTETQTFTDIFSAYVLPDSGVYTITGSSTGRVKACAFQVALRDLSNLNSTIHAGRNLRDSRIIAGERNTLSIPITYGGAMDDFRNVEGGSNDLVKYLTDTFSNLLSEFSDIDMENHLIKNIDACVTDVSRLDMYDGAPKLGGFIANETIDFTVTAAGTDPIAFTQRAVKDTLNNILTFAETETEFTNQTQREWVMLGYKLDVQRFVDNSFFTADGNVADGETRFGFKKEGVYAYTDSFANRVKLIGSTDKRFEERKDASGHRLVYGFMRSNDTHKQPTAVYFGYDFRITRGTYPGNNLNTIQNVQFWSHEVWDILTMVGVKLTVVNPKNLYNAVAASSKERS